MTARSRTPLRVVAVLGLATLGCATLASPATAADDDVTVVNTETIQVYTDATGAVDTRRVYEQVSLTGTGSVDLANPIETDGLRNLDGFGGFDVRDGKQVATVDVRGKERLRTVSNFTGDLPLDVKVAYYLDGEPVEPGDVVGESGELEVRYTVTNVTGADQEVTFDDGKGGTVTKTVNVPVPMVGSLTTVAPSTFTDVRSDEANMAGDGKGGTKLSFTMTLFPPLGSDTAEFGYTADITDGVVPRATISALPVNPLESPTFKTAADSYQGGADTGLRLTDGAGQIDTNLLKLRDGAGELLAGLIKLRDGADKLEAGLAGVAAPGADKLADGTSELSDGLGRLDDGLGKIADGSGELAAGADRAAVGGGKLRDGAGRLSGGLGELSGGVTQLDDGARQILEGQKALRAGLRLLEDGVEVLPQSVRDELAGNVRYQSLLGGLEAVAVGLGGPNDLVNTETGQPTFYGALVGIDHGLTNPAATMTACATKDTTKCGATDALDFISYKLGVALTAPASVEGTVAKLKATIESIALAPDCGPVCKATVAGVAKGVADAQTASLTDLKDGVDTVSGGIKTKVTGPGAAIDRLQGALYNPNADPRCSEGAATADKSDDCGIQQAVAFFKLSIPVLVDSITESISSELLAGISVPSTGCDPDAMTLLCGGNALVAGSRDLKNGTAKLRAGAGELDAGGALVYDKLTELATGLDKIAAGAGRLADGAVKAKDGTGRAADGSVQVADGAGRLADGLGEAADGSGLLADGLGKAAGGAPKLEDGAQRLSDEGTSKLVEAGEATAQNYGEMYATIVAGAERAQDEKMAYGAPAGAVGLTAYSYEILGEDGEGSRNLTRGVGGLAVLAAGAGAFALRRRVI